MNVPGKEGQIVNGNDEAERIPFAWKVYQSKAHPDRCYYFNTITRETVWDVPVRDLAIVEKSKEEAAMRGFRPVSIASSQGSTCSNRSSSLLMPGTITTNRSAPSQTDSSQAGPSQSPFGYNHWPQMPDGSSGKEHSGMQPPRMDELPGPSGGNYPANMHFSDPRVRVSDVGVPATASVVKVKHPRILIAKQTSGNLRCGPSYADYNLTILDAQLLIQNYFRAEVKSINNGRKLYIVLDKLFLVEHLIFVTLLQKAIHNVSVDGTILVPKEVLLELDQMQSENARRAIRFMNRINDTDSKFVVETCSLQSPEQVKSIFTMMQSRQKASNLNAFTMMRCMQLVNDDHVVVLLTTDPDLEIYEKGFDLLSVLLYNQVVKLLHLIKDMQTAKKLNSQVPTVIKTRISNKIADPILKPKTQNIDISKVTAALLAEAHKRTLKMDEQGAQIAEKKLKLKCPEPNEVMYQNGELIDATKAKGNKAERKMITFGGEDTIWRHTKVIDSSKTINEAVEESTSVTKPLLQGKPTHREIEMQALITSEQQQNRNNNGLLEDDDGQSDSGEVSVSDYWDDPPSIAVLQERFRSIRTKMEHAFKLIVQTFNDLRNWNSKEPLLSDLLDFLLKKYSYSGNTRAEWIMCETILPLKNLLLKEMCGGLKAVKLMKKSHLVKFYKLSYKTSKQLKTFNPEMVDLDVIMLDIQNIGRQLQPMTQPSDFTAPVANAPVQNDSNVEYNNQNQSNTSNYSNDVTDGPPAVQRNMPPPLLSLKIANPFMSNQQTSPIKNPPKTNNDRNHSNFDDYSTAGQLNKAPPLLSLKIAMSNRQTSPVKNLPNTHNDQNHSDFDDYSTAGQLQSGANERGPQALPSTSGYAITERGTKKKRVEGTDGNYNQINADCSRTGVDKQSPVKKDCYPSTSSTFDKFARIKSQESVSSDSDESYLPTSPCKAAVAQVEAPIKKAIERPLRKPLKAPIRKAKTAKKLLIKKPVRALQGKVKFENLGIIRRTVVNNLAPAPPQSVEQPAALTQPVEQPTAPLRPVRQPPVPLRPVEQPASPQQPIEQPAEPPRLVEQPLAGIEELSPESTDPKAFLVTVIRPLIKLLRATVLHSLNRPRRNSFSGFSQKDLVHKMNTIKKPLQTLINMLKTITLRFPISKSEAEAFMNATGVILKLSGVDNNVGVSFEQIEQFVHENESGSFEYWKKLMYLRSRFNQYLLLQEESMT